MQGLRAERVNREEEQGISDKLMCERMYRNEFKGTSSRELCSLLFFILKEELSNISSITEPDLLLL